MGASHQYSGALGGVGLCQIAVHLTYALPRGHALIGRELYLPAAWAEDEERRLLRHVPDKVTFATKPQLAAAMLHRARQLGLPARWFTGYEVYGSLELRRTARTLWLRLRPDGQGRSTAARSAAAPDAGRNPRAPPRVLTHDEAARARGRVRSSGMSARRWAVGTGAVVVLVATGTWAMRPGTVDTGLWDEIRPVIEARLAAESRGTGYGEDVPGLHTRWFCRAEALDVAERGGEVRAGVDTLCLEYGVRDGGLVECGGGKGPQVVRLERDPHGGYRVLSREAPPDGAGNEDWTEAHFGSLSRAALDGTIPSDPLERAARAHFGLPADAPVGDC